jgi:hypothetical protein
VHCLRETVDSFVYSNSCALPAAHFNPVRRSHCPAPLPPPQLPSLAGARAAVGHALDDDDLDIIRSLNAASARGDGNDMHTALRRYREWSHARGEQPLRPLDPTTATLGEKAAEVARLMRFVHWGVRHLGVAPETMMGYMSIINANHRRRTFVGLAGDMDLGLLAELAKGMARSHVPRPSTPRYGTAPRLLARGMDIALGPRSAALDTALRANLRAAVATTFAGVLRGCESCLQQGKQFHPLRDPTRADVRSRASGKVMAIHEAKRVSLAGVALQKTTDLLLVAGGAFIDASAEIDAMFLADPVPRERWATTPLFRNPVTNRPILVSQLAATVKAIMAAVGRDPRNFGAHSLRIGAATALFAAGATPDTIRVMGRWWSGAYRLYIRGCEGQAADLLLRAASSAAVDLADQFDDDDMDDAL